MTQLIAWVSPKRALVAVNTQDYGDARGAAESSKIYFLPHANTVMAGRGHAALHLAAFVQVQMVSPKDFEGIVALLPHALSQIFPDLVQRASETDQVDLAGWSAAQELYVIGWSPQQGRMRNAAFVKNPGESVFRQSEFGPYLIAPWEDQLGPVREPSSIAAIEKIAGTAHRVLSHKGGPSACLGGRLVIADITRDAVTTVVRPIR